MKTQTEYVDFNAAGDLTRVGCMACNKTLGIREWLPAVQMQGIKLQSHTRRLTVVIGDGTIAEILLCPDCIDRDDLDMEHLERTMHLGWMKEQLAVYKNQPNLQEKLEEAAEMSRAKRISGRGK